MKTADLHFHSLHSDGRHSVQELGPWLREAAKDGLSLAVLTDHDGIAGFEEFQTEVGKLWPVICASELSCEFNDPATGMTRELHFLVYGIPQADPEFQLYFEKFTTARERRFFDIGKKLNEAGYDLDLDAVAKRHFGVLGRPHLADALIEKGVVKDRQEAFERFLYDGSSFDVKKWRLPLERAMEVVRRKNLKASIAHPGQYKFREPQLRYFASLQVDAIEIFHPRHSIEDVAYYTQQAKKFGFDMTGGSDFHQILTDQVDQRPSLGRSRYPYEQAQKFFGDWI